MASFFCPALRMEIFHVWVADSILSLASLAAHAPEEVHDTL